MRATAARPEHAGPVNPKRARKARRLGAAIVLLATVGLVPTAASPAQAHTSTYCGHGTDGILYITKYVGSVYSGYPYVHIHRYQHVQFWRGIVLESHYANRICSVH